MINALIFLVAFLLSASNAYGAEIAYEKNLVVYFYSTACASCGKVSDYIDEISQAAPSGNALDGLGLQNCSECAAVLDYINAHNGSLEFNIKKVNIAEAAGKELLSVYNQHYGVSEDDEDVIPVIFAGDVYAVGENDIKAALAAVFDTKSSILTPALTPNSEIELEKFSALKILPVFLAGLANGLNPCGLSMLLLFLAALIDGGKKFIAAGFVYCAARFVSYFVLGTALYGLLARFNFAAVGRLGIWIVMAVMLVMAAANSVDFVNAKMKKYAKIRVQLPKKLKDFNQNLIKRLVKNNTKMIFALSFVLGVIISFGEFLCTGQIYLGTIVTALNAYQSARPSALLMFGVYNVAMSVVPVAALLVVAKTYSVFNAANFVQERLPAIKLVNAAIYIAFIIVLFFTNFR